MKYPFEVCVIGGTGVQTKAYPTISAVGKWFMDNGVNTHFVDGAYKTEDRLIALTPRDQANIVIENLQKNGSPLDHHTLFISHCLGMAAAVQAIDTLPNDSSLVALSPPLPSPIETIQTIHSKNNIVSKNGTAFIPGYSWSDEPFKPTKTAKRIDVELPIDQRIRELEADEIFFKNILNELHTADRLRMVTAKRDWNIRSPLQAQHFKDTLELDVTHALIDHANVYAVEQPADIVVKYILNFLRQLQIPAPAAERMALDSR